MKNTGILLVATIILSLTALSGCNKAKVADMGGVSFPTSLSDYSLVWSDEFNDSLIDQSKWSFDTANGCQISPDLCGWGNNELQYYTKTTHNAYLQNGNLVIKAVKEVPPYMGQYQYTSARLNTRFKGDFKYGRIDVRAKLPTGKGLWPAIWMLSTDQQYGPWPTSGEIDIMENTGDQPKRVFSTLHYGLQYDQYKSQGYTLGDTSGTFHTRFHVFTLLWNDQAIKFQVDGNDVGSPVTRSSVLPSPFPFDQPFYLILNVAVGGNLPGNPDGTTIFPQKMEVDYVRVYKQK